ncbi:MAG: 2TM domain-containing protein [Nanoarchaeota archaeon]
MTVYILVNTMLITINILYSPGEIWFFFPLLGWGIGLVSHYVGSIAWID